MYETPQYPNQNHSYDIRQELSRLMNVAKTRQNAYRKAIEEAQSSKVKAALQKNELQQTQFTAELKRLLGSLGQHDETNTPDDFSSWRSFQRHSDEAILAACVQIEESAIVQYEYVLADPLPRHVRAILQKHYQTFLDARAYLLALESSFYAFN